MALSGKKRGNFLVLSKGKDGPKGRINRLFLPEGDKADGWWQMMEAIHVVVDVKLIPPDWVTKKGGKSALVLESKKEHVIFMFKCPTCCLELGLQEGKRFGTTFAETLLKPAIDTTRVGQESLSGQKELGRVDSNFEFKKNWAHVREYEQEPKFGRVKSEPRRKLLWNEKGKWVD